MKLHFAQCEFAYTNPSLPMTGILLIGEKLDVIDGFKHISISFTEAYRRQDFTISAFELMYPSDFAFGKTGAQCMSLTLSASFKNLSWYVSMSTGLFSSQNASIQHLRPFAIQSFSQLQHFPFRRPEHKYCSSPSSFPN